MKYFGCQFQIEAKEQVINSLKLNDLVFLQGTALCGKSTLVSLLFSGIDSSRKIWPIVIHSSWIHLCGSFWKALSDALGLPDRVASESSGALTNILREVNDSGMTIVLVIDDIDTFIKGAESKFPDLCQFILFLKREIRSIKVLATLANFHRVETLAKDLCFSAHHVVEMQCWPNDRHFGLFVAYIAGAHGIKKYQVLHEHFLNALYCCTRGATGSVVQVIKVMAVSGVLADGQVATPRNISHLWRY